MSRLNRSRWILLLPLLAAFAGFSQTVPTQPREEAPTAAPAVRATPSTSTPALQPKKPPTHEDLGDSLSARQRYQAAITEYSKSPQMTASLWNKMGIAYQMMLNPKDATRCYRESLKLDPKNAQVLNNLGTIYASQKEYGQADRWYRKALKIDPNSALIYKNMGTNLLAEHKYNKGWDAYKQALALDPQIFSDHSSPTVEDPSNIQERGAMNYYMAAGCARAGYVDCALQYLRIALNEGFTTRKKVAADAEFASLRNNAAFQQLLKEEEQRNQ